MKKVIALVLTIVLAVCGTISGFAWSSDMADFNEAENGTPINSQEYDSTVLDIRNSWTVSRNGTNDSNSGNTDTWNTASVIVDDEVGTYAKFVAPQWVNCDQTYEAKSTVSVDLRKDDTNGFTGFVFNYGADYTVVQQNLNTQNDYYYTEFEAVSSDMDYAMATGFGFTFVEGSDSIIRYFVRTLNGTHFDVISYDYDTGYDLTNAFHNFTMYSPKAGYAQFNFDGTTVATILYSNEQQLSAVATTYRTLDCAYYRNATIVGANGATAATTTNALISGDNTINCAICGTGSTLYADNFICSTLSRVSFDYNDDGIKDTDDCAHLLRYVSAPSSYSIGNHTGDLDKDGNITSDDVVIFVKSLFYSDLYDIEDEVVAIDVTDAEDDEAVDNEGYFEIAYNTTSYVNIGGTIGLSATYNLHAGGTYSVSFESLTNSVASCDANGNVTGIREGVATIRCTAANGRYVDFYVTVLSDNISSALMTAVQANNSNVFTRYNLGIGAGTPAYYRNIIGSVSQILYNDELSIDTTYYSVGTNTTHNDGWKSTYGFANEYVTVHYTGNMSVGATAKANASYFAYSSNVSIHYTTGNDGVYYVMDEGLTGWHCGDSGSGKSLSWYATGVAAPSSGDQTPEWSISSNGKFMINGVETVVSVPSRSYIYTNSGATSDNISITGPTFVYNGVTYPCITEMGLPWKVVDGQYYMGETWWCATQKVGGRICGTGGNFNSIGIESCVNPETDLWYTWHKTAQLCAYILKNNGLGVSRVTGHNMWSSKNCPQPFLENDMEIWDEFIEMVTAEYDKLMNHSDITYTMTMIKGFDCAWDYAQDATLEYNGTTYTYTLAPGRVIPGLKAKCLLYEVTTSTGESIMLASAINSIYTQN